MTVGQKLHLRGQDHDRTKLEAPEKEAFDNLSLNLKDHEYGSDEYKTVIRETLGPALKHHYENNTHHPEHFENGIAGMSLLDLIEMLVDWKAASERMSEGDIYKSIELNIERFEIDDQLAQILRNTAREMGWEESSEN